MKYFATDSKSFPDHGVKFKSGEVVELTAEAAAVYNGIARGMFVPYESETHTPAPTVAAPVEPTVPVDTTEKVPADPFVTPKVTE